MEIGAGDVVHLFGLNSLCAFTFYKVAECLEFHFRLIFGIGVRLQDFAKWCMEKNRTRRSEHLQAGVQDNGGHGSSFIFFGVAAAFPVSG